MADYPVHEFDVLVIGAGGAGLGAGAGFAPQFGQAAASVLTSRPHSRHFTSAINLSPLIS